jgi:hypothetical protein
VPVSVFDALLNDMPAGTPLAVQVYVPVSPVALKAVACEYAVPTVAKASVVGVTLMVGQLRVKEIDTLPGQPFASVAVIVMLLVPEVVGVPMSFSAVVSSVMPAGNPDDVHV